MKLSKPMKFKTKYETYLNSKLLLNGFESNNKIQNFTPIILFIASSFRLSLLLSNICFKSSCLRTKDKANARLTVQPNA